MGEGNLTRMGDVAATDQTGMADGVMRGAERTVLKERYTNRKRICHGINAGRPVILRWKCGEESKEEHEP